MLRKNAKIPDPFILHFFSFFSPATIGCGLLNNITSVASYISINMTIQICVEVCRGALMPIAAIKVII